MKPVLATVLFVLLLASCARHREFVPTRTVSYFRTSQDHWAAHPDWAIKNATRIEKLPLTEEVALVCRRDAHDALGCEIEDYSVYELPDRLVYILKFEIKKKWVDGAWHQSMDGRLAFYVDARKGEIVSAYGGSE